MKCADCGTPTKVIQRFVGFFGINEVYSRWCREHITDHAEEVNMTKEDVLAMHDRLVKEVEQSKLQYKQRKESRT